jgi:hypothetical protein
MITNILHKFNFSKERLVFHEKINIVATFKNNIENK